MVIKWLEETKLVKESTSKSEEDAKFKETFAKFCKETGIKRAPNSHSDYYNGWYYQDVIFADGSKGEFYYSASNDVTDLALSNGKCICKDRNYLSVDELIIRYKSLTTKVSISNCEIYFEYDENNVNDLIKEYKDERIKEYYPTGWVNRTIWNNWRNTAKKIDAELAHYEFNWTEVVDETLKNLGYYDGPTKDNIISACYKYPDDIRLEEKKDEDRVIELEESTLLKESYDTDGEWLSNLDYNTINKLIHTPATYSWGTLFEDQEELDEFIRRCDELNIKITLLPDINSQYQDVEVQCTLAQLLKLSEASDIAELISMYDIEVFY